MITKVSKYAFSPAQTVQLCGLGDLLAVVGDDLVVHVDLVVLGDLVVGHQLVVELLVLVLGTASNATNDTLVWFKKCKFATNIILIASMYVVASTSICPIRGNAAVSFKTFFCWCF